MLIAILSDTHDNAGAVRQALDVAGRRGAQTVLHCGDVCAVSTLDLFRGWTLHLAFGNMDRDRGGLRRRIELLGNSGTCGPEAHLEVDGLRIVALHGDKPDLLTEYLRLGRHDMLFHGHTHRRRDERIGSVRVINPGALGAAALESRSFVLLDTIVRSVEFVALQNACDSPE